MSCDWHGYQTTVMNKKERIAAQLALIEKDRALMDKLENIIPSDMGLCSYTGPLDEDVILRKLFAKWPEFSGDSHYPVPSCSPDCSAYDAYWCSERRMDQSQRTDYLWNKGKYAYARRRLVAFCVEELRRRIAARQLLLKLYNVRPGMAGICSQVSADTTAQRSKLSSLFKSWPLYSGLLGFPIPHPKDPYPGNVASASDHYFVHQCDPERRKTYLWGRSKYARLRKDLLKHCIETLDKELSE